MTAPCDNASRREEADTSAASPQSSLLTFFKWAMQEGPWQGGDLDGGIVQDKAESLGLIVPVPYDPEKHGAYNDCGCDAGDPWFEFSPALHSQAVTGSWATGDELIALCMDMLGDVPGETLDIRVEKLVGYHLEMQVMLSDARAQVERTITALKFYGSEWEIGPDDKAHPSDLLEVDRGRVARSAIRDVTTALPSTDGDRHG